MEWIPIGHRGSYLQPLKSTRRSAALVTTQPAAHPLIDVRVSNQEISVNVAGNIGLGAIFSGSASSNEVGYWLEAMAYTDQFEQLPPAGG